jgi:hypothetical protein
MPDDSAILSSFRAELLEAGLVRRPADNPAGGLHPAHVERRGGTPAPGEGEGNEVDAVLVIGIRASGDVTPANNYAAAQSRELVIDVIYRSAGNAGDRAAMALDAAIRARLIRPETNYGYGFILAPATAPLVVHQAALFGGLGLVSDDAGVVDRVAKYVIECAP